MCTRVGLDTHTYVSGLHTRPAQANSSQPRQEDAFEGAQNDGPRCGRAPIRQHGLAYAHLACIRWVYVILARAHTYTGHLSLAPEARSYAPMRLHTLVAVIRLKTLCTGRGLVPTGRVGLSRPRATDSSCQTRGGRANKRSGVLDHVSRRAGPTHTYLHGLGPHGAWGLVFAWALLHTLAALAGAVKRGGVPDHALPRRSHGRGARIRIRLGSALTLPRGLDQLVWALLHTLPLHGRAFIRYGHTLVFTPLAHGHCSCARGIRTGLLHTALGHTLGGTASHTRAAALGSSPRALV